VRHDHFYEASILEVLPRSRKKRSLDSGDGLETWIVESPETIVCFLQTFGKNLIPVYGISCFVVGSEMNPR
jgi:hypothetical protein